MFKVLAVLLAILMLSSFSYAGPKEVAEGSKDAVVSVVEGAGTGVTDLGKGTVGAVGGTVKAAGYGLVGHGDEAVQAGKEGYQSGKEGVEGAVKEPTKGVVGFFKNLWAGITGKK